ncbi:MAG: hypothetical protein ACI4RI_00250 [Ruminococcus sp.]
MFKFGKISRVNQNEVEVTFTDEDTTELIPILDNGYTPHIDDDVVVIFNYENQAVVVGRVL